jgi:tetratricopeptide (TPR) repeat protein
LYLYNIGDSITSTVLHGSAMRYDVETFAVDVQLAWENSLGIIATTKRKLIEGETRKKDIKNELIRRDEELKLRRAAYNFFIKERDRGVVAVQKIKGSNNQIIQRVFKQFVENVQQMKNMRILLYKLLNSIRRRYLSSAFMKWTKGHFGLDSHDTTGFIGIGSINLELKKKEREDIQNELRGIISDFASIKRDMSVMKLTTDQRRTLLQSSFLPNMEEGFDYKYLYMHNGLRFLSEADSLTLVNKFQQAYHLYESQIIYLRSETNVNIKLLSLCYGRLGKLFLREEKYDRAIVEFDHQMSLSKEISDNVEEAEAYFGIGSGYLGRCDYIDAIKYLEVACIRYQVLGHIAKSCDCMKSLRECYIRMQRLDLVEIYDKKIEFIQLEHQRKTDYIKSSLDGFKERLVVQSAEEELTVMMERTSFRTIELRHSLDDKHNERIQRVEF